MRASMDRTGSLPPGVRASRSPPSSSSPPSSPSPRSLPASLTASLAARELAASLSRRRSARRAAALPAQGSCACKRHGQTAFTNAPRGGSANLGGLAARPTERAQLGRSCTPRCLTGFQWLRRRGCAGCPARPAPATLSWPRRRPRPPGRGPKLPSCRGPTRGAACERLKERARRSASPALPTAPASSHPVRPLHSRTAAHTLRAKSAAALRSAPAEAQPHPCGGACAPCAAGFKPVRPHANERCAALHELRLEAAAAYSPLAARCTAALHRAPHAYGQQRPEPRKQESGDGEGAGNLGNDMLCLPTANNTRRGQGLSLESKLLRQSSRWQHTQAAPQTGCGQLRGARAARRAALTPTAPLAGPREAGSAP